MNCHRIFFCDFPCVKLVSFSFSYHSCPLGRKQSCKWHLFLLPLNFAKYRLGAYISRATSAIRLYDDSEFEFLRALIFPTRELLSNFVKLFPGIVSEYKIITIFKNHSLHDTEFVALQEKKRKKRKKKGSKEIFQKFKRK